MVCDRRFVGSLSGFQILFGVRPLADHDDAPVDLDFGIVGDGLGLRDIGLGGCERRSRSLNARQRLLDDCLAVGYGGPRRIEVSLCGSVAESMGRIVGETPLPVEEAESGTVPRGMPAPASGTPSPNPWDLSLSRQNVCSTLKELERRIGLRRDATRAPIQGPEWQGAGFH